jgi:DNA-binding response OmpR family regulator
METKILIVDDEPLLVKGLKHSLEQEGYSVECAYDGETGLEYVRKGGIDLVILDVMLPKKDGFTVCREIRSYSNVPIIMLTAKGEDIDRIVGIEIGADDYLTKPFNTRELLARIKALLRRAGMSYNKDDHKLLKVGELKIDIKGRRAFLKGKEIDLTSKEFDILYILAKTPGRVYSREKLLELVWGYDFFGDVRTVDVHIRRLREKLEEDPGRPYWILTKWGAGYYCREMV